MLAQSKGPGNVLNSSAVDIQLFMSESHSFAFDTESDSDPDSDADSASILREPASPALPGNRTLSCITKGRTIRLELAPCKLTSL